MKFELDLLRLSHDLAAHASARQELVAQNVANADTPGYRARDLGAFADHVADSSAGFGARATRAGHFPVADRSPAFAAIEMQTGPSGQPNGSNVALEDQMMKSAEIRQDHDLALGIYRKSLDILRLSLGRGR